MKNELSNNQRALLRRLRRNFRTIATKKEGLVKGYQEILRRDATLQPSVYELIIKKTTESAAELRKLASEADAMLHSDLNEEDLNDLRERGLAFIAKSQIIWEEISPYLQKDMKKSLI